MRIFPDTTNVPEIKGRTFFDAERARGRK